MKKLIIALGVMAAACAEAATVNWSVMGLQDKTGAALNGGYAYVFTTKGDYATTVAALTTTLAAATDATTFKAALGEFTSMTALSGDVNAGAQSSGELSISASGLKPNTSGTKLFALIIDTATITDSTYWYVTETSNSAKTGASDSAIGTAAFSISDTGSHTASNWAAVPEPTSGLLMLLGMAGLALRRRRA